MAKELHLRGGSVTLVDDELFDELAAYRCPSGSKSAVTQRHGTIQMISK